MPYDLTSAEERARLLIALLHEGGSEDDQCYLADAVHAGYVLTPPPDLQPASNPCALPEDTVTVRLRRSGRVLEMAGIPTIRVGKVWPDVQNGWVVVPFGLDFLNDDIYGPHDTEAEARAALMAAAKEALGG